MNRYHHRVQALEDRYAPVDPHVMTRTEREWFLGLCAPIAVEVVQWFAELLAERRYHDALGTSAPWCGDWKSTTSDAERDAAVMSELDRLRALDGNDDQAITDWVETADREGWPPLTGVTFRMDRAGFEDMVTRRRASIDVSRGCDMPGSVLWRRAHPTWRPGMTGDEALAFEHELMGVAT